MLALAACSQPQDPPAEPPEAEDTAPEAQEEQVERVSILRPEIELPDPEPDPVLTPEPLGPFKATIGFPEGGKALDSQAIATLDAALASEQIALGLPITLSAHSDSGGSDRVNLEVSEERGLAVAQWLIDKGVDPDRITVVAFGEQNPVEPNALPDGTPNERGREINRRVEIEIAASQPPTDEQDAAGQSDEASPATLESGKTVSVETSD
jgi:OOP family OmpA-OmpF porin